MHDRRQETWGEKCGDHVEEVKGQCPYDLSSRGHFPGDQAVDMRASGTSREGAFLPLVMAAQALRGWAGGALGTQIAGRVMEGNPFITATCPQRRE